MSYTTQQLLELYQRTVDLYKITALGNVVASNYTGVTRDALVYEVTFNDGSNMEVFIIADPESGEFLATNDI